MYLLLGMALVEALTLGYARFEHHRYVTAASERDVAIADLTSYRTRQQAYISRLVNEGAQASAAADLKAKELDNERKIAVARYADLARRLPGRDAPINPATRGLLDDAIRTANAGKDPAPATHKPVEDPAPIATDTGALVDWSLAAIDAYKACRDQVTELQVFYNRLRDAQESVHQ